MASHTKQNRIKRHACIGLISLFNMSFMPILSFASPSVHDLLDYGPPENMSGPMAATATFQQKANTSGGTDASSVSKVTLRYFTSTDCSGSTAGTYNTPDGTSYSINTSTTFGLNSVSTYGVGNTQLSLNMSTINSVAIFLKSTNNNTPQADFTGSCGTNPSFCCVRIDCSSGTECTQVGGIGTQNFQLKTTAAIGDPADGGVIGCMNGELNNLVVPAADNSTGTKQWGGYGTTTNATSTTDGATNTSTIVAALGAGTTYAAGICNAYTTTGGFTTGWFLPAGNNSGASGQLNCLYTNKAAIGGFTIFTYWSSTESDDINAWSQGFSSPDLESFGSKDLSNKVRCARAFTP